MNLKLTNFKQINTRSFYIYNENKKYSLPTYPDGDARHLVPLRTPGGDELLTAAEISSVDQINGRNAKRTGQIGTAHV